MSTEETPTGPKQSQSNAVPQPDGATGSEPKSFSPATAKEGEAQTKAKQSTPVIEVTGQQPPKASAKPPRTQKPVPERVGPRRVRLAVSRVDPWSVMKLSFLLSIAVGIMVVVASVVFWLVLDKLHVFTDIDAVIKDVLGTDTKVNVLQFVELARAASLRTIIAVIDVVLLTALGTIGAFLYNVVAALVGGIHLTMTDD